MSCALVALLGTGSAGHPYRAQSSVLVEYQGFLTLIDAGCCSWKNLLRLGYAVSDVDLILVTHAHNDHVCSIPHLAFLLGYKAPGATLRIAAPNGHLDIVRAMVEPQAKLSGARVHYQALQPGAWTPEGGGVMVIEAFRAIHIEGSLSYILDLKGLGRVYVSGDTALSEAHARAASQSMLAIHEATLPAGMGEDAARSGHTSVDQAYSIVASAELGVLYHLSLDSEKSAVEYVGRRGGGRIIVPMDGAVIKLC